MSALAADSNHPASTVAARSARVARIQAQDVEHISEI